MTIKIKPNTLKNIENICIATSFISAGGFLSGALVENERLALISGAIGIASALGAYYSSNKQRYLEKEDAKKENKYNNTQ